MDRVVNEFAQMNPGRETGYTPLKPEIPDDPPEPMRRTAGQPTPTPQPPPAEKPPQPQPAPSPQPPPGPSPAEPDQASAAGVDYSTTGAEAEVQEEDLLGHDLTKPILAHGETLHRLTWREPTGGDIERAGNPIVVSGMGSGEPRLSFDEMKMSKMISQLASVPPSSVKMLAARDWTQISLKIFRFFM